MGGWENRKEKKKRENEMKISRLYILFGWRKSREGKKFSSLIWLTKEYE